jgi:hypothetical protein
VGVGEWRVCMRGLKLKASVCVCGGVCVCVCVCVFVCGGGGGGVCAHSRVWCVCARCGCDVLINNAGIALSPPCCWCWWPQCRCRASAKSPAGTSHTVRARHGQRVECCAAHEPRRVTVLVPLLLTPISPVPRARRGSPGDGLAPRPPGPHQSLVFYTSQCSAVALGRESVC